MHQIVTLAYKVLTSVGVPFPPLHMIYLYNLSQLPTGCFPVCVPSTLCLFVNVSLSVTSTQRYLYVFFLCMPKLSRQNKLEGCGN